MLLAGSTLPGCITVRVHCSSLLCSMPLSSTEVWDLSEKQCARHPCISLTWCMEHSHAQMLGCWQELHYRASLNFSQFLYFAYGLVLWTTHTSVICSSVHPSYLRLFICPPILRSSIHLSTCPAFIRSSVHPSCLHPFICLPIMPSSIHLWSSHTYRYWSSSRYVWIFYPASK